MESGLCHKLNVDCIAGQRSNGEWMDAERWSSSLHLSSRSLAGDQAVTCRSPLGDWLNSRQSPLDHSPFFVQNWQQFHNGCPRSVEMDGCPPISKQISTLELKLAWRSHEWKVASRPSETCGTPTGRRWFTMTLSPKVAARSPTGRFSSIGMLA